MQPTAAHSSWVRTLVPLLLLAALAAPGPVTSASATPPANERGQARASVPGSATTDRGVPADGTLEGVDWVLVAYRSGDALVELDDPRGPARLRFEDGRVSGNGGCNHLSGAFTRQGEGLHFDPSMVSTMMACPEPLMAQEQAVHAALGAVVSHRLAADRLELLGAAGELLLGLVPLAPAPLTGTIWHLIDYNNGREALVSAEGGTEITLELRPDGTLGGSDGCNRYMSGFTLDGERLRIGPIATTRMACQGPESAREQAGAYATALGTVTAFRITGGELTLVDAEGRSAARFRAELE